jgi:hypothetical protein
VFRVNIGLQHVRGTGQPYSGIALEKEIDLLVYELCGLTPED